MRFTQSLNKNYQFGFVYSKGRAAANKHLVMYVVKNKRLLNANRLGITVSKKVGKSVVRSRVTRLIKESYRLCENNIQTGHDIVILARAGAAEASYFEINKSLLNLLKRQNLLKQAQPGGTPA